jgi:hypothetical protein
MAAINTTANVVEVIPEKYLSYDMCMAAVTLDGLAIKHVPAGMRQDYSICKAAYDENPAAIEWITAFEDYEL